MKTLLKVLAVLASLGILGLLLALFLTSGLTDTADKFFTAIRSKQYQVAYGLLSEDFRSSTSYEEFIAFLNKNALLGYKEASWTNRSSSGSKGELDGTVTTETGGTIPVKLSMVKENNSWRIYSIQKVRSGILADDATEGSSGAVDHVALVRGSMRDFAEAVMAKDFTEFHRKISQLWQRQITPEEFNRIFKGFIDANLDLLFLDNYVPVFEKSPEIDEHGVLSIKGYYPTKPSRVMFDFGYIREGKAWRLVKTNINIKPVD